MPTTRVTDARRRVLLDQSAAEHDEPGQIRSKCVCEPHVGHATLTEAMRYAASRVGGVGGGPASGACAGK